jgi:hypothetical protein
MAPMPAKKVQKERRQNEDAAMPRNDRHPTLILIYTDSDKPCRSVTHSFIYPTAIHRVQLPVSGRAWRED